MTYEDAIKKCNCGDTVWYTDNDGKDHEVKITAITQRGEALVAFYGADRFDWVSVNELEYAL